MSGTDPQPSGGAPPRVLAIDVGGTSVKVRTSEHDEMRKHPSGPEFTPQDMVDAVRDLCGDWEYDVIAIGFPGPVVAGRPTREPHNLAAGWVDFDFEAAFGKPVRMLNDAAMQALGSYQGGTMLFLGLGTGLGSAVVVDGKVAPLELAHLPYKDGGSYEDYVGKRGLESHGLEKWRLDVEEVVDLLGNALLVDYVVIGGGNTAKLEKLPERTRRGANANAFLGGFRLWGLEAD